MTVTIAEGLVVDGSKDHKYPNTISPRSVSFFYALSFYNGPAD